MTHFWPMRDNRSSCARTRLFAPWLWTGMVLLLAGPAAGQQPDALRHHASDAPIHIRSDHLQVINKKNQAIFTGQVEVDQDALHITSDELRVDYQDQSGDEKEQGEIERMVFSGGVAFAHRQRKGGCARAVYDRKLDRLTCTGDPWIRQGEDRLRGELIVYYLKRDEVQVTRPRAVIHIPEKKAGRPTERGAQPQ